MALVDNVWYVDYGNGSSTGYFSVTSWVTVTNKVCGNLIRATAPAVGSERVFVCTASTAGTGATGVSEPTWTNTRGALNTDGTVTWQEATGVAALNGDLSTNTPNWTTVKNTAITLGQVIQNNAGNLILICTTAGTAGNGSEPSWAAFTNAGATTADNTATWTTLGASFSAWAAPHARIENATSSTWGQAGNSFFVASEHASTRTTPATMAFPGTSASPNFVTCVTKTTVPPVSANVTTGATCTTTSTGGQSFNGVVNINGISFTAGSSSSSAQFALASASQSDIALKNCALIFGGTGNSSRVTIGAGSAANARVFLDNTPMTFASVSTGIALFTGIFTWRNTASAIGGATFPTNLFVDATFPSAGVALLEGVDLSALGSGKNIVGSGVTGSWNIYLKDCKLNASVTVAATPSQVYGAETYAIRADSGATNYRSEKYIYSGTQTVETTIIRTGGATDGTTGISDKIVTTANSKWIRPFECIPITFWNDSTSAITTLTLYGTTTGGGVPKDDEIWFDCEYLGSASTSQGSFITTTKADNLAASAATNNSSDASTWGGSGAGNGFKIVCPSFTPGMKGPITIYLKVAKASSTYYIDPKPSISGVTISKSFINAPGVYSNELQSAATGTVFVIGS